MSETLIVNARLVNEGREFDGDLRISRGRIAEIGSGLSARDGEYVIDAAGRRLLPGMIDDQVHFREPGLEYKADIATESAAAVAGGLTSFMDMPNTSPPTLDAAALQNKYDRAAGRAWGNYGVLPGRQQRQPRRDPHARSADRAGHQGVHGRIDRQHAGRRSRRRSMRSSARRRRRSSPTAKTRRRSTPTSPHTRRSTATTSRSNAIPTSARARRA